MYQSQNPGVFAGLVLTSLRNARRTATETLPGKAGPLERVPIEIRLPTATTNTPEPPYNSLADLDFGYTHELDGSIINISAPQTGPKSVIIKDLIDSSRSFGADVAVILRGRRPLKATLTLLVE